MEEHKWKTCGTLQAVQAERNGLYASTGDWALAFTLLRRLVALLMVFYRHLLMLQRHVHWSCFMPHTTDEYGVPAPIPVPVENL